MLDERYKVAGARDAYAVYGVASPLVKEAVAPLVAAGLLAALRGAGAWALKGLAGRGLAAGARALGSRGLSAAKSLGQKAWQANKRLGIDLPGAKTNKVMKALNWANPVAKGSLPVTAGFEAASRAGADDAVRAAGIQPQPTPKLMRDGSLSRV